jgi:hypothetical protein
MKRQSKKRVSNRRPNRKPDMGEKGMEDVTPDAPDHTRQGAEAVANIGLVLQRKGCKVVMSTKVALCLILALFLWSLLRAEGSWNQFRKILPRALTPRVPNATSPATSNGAVDAQLRRRNSMSCVWRDRAGRFQK